MLPSEDESHSTGVPAHPGAIGRRAVLATGAALLVVATLNAVSGPAEAAWDDLAWGPPNGEIPPDKMVKLPWNGMYLERAAAADMERLNMAFKERFGVNLSMTGTYRTLEKQIELFQKRYTTTPTGSGVTKVWNGVTYYLKKGQAMSAVPGKSNHGYARAIDFTTGSGLEGSLGTTRHNWLMSNAPRFGWVNPTWAHNGGPDDESWHFEYAAGGSTSPGPDPDEREGDEDMFSDADRIALAEIRGALGAGGAASLPAADTVLAHSRRIDDIQVVVNQLQATVNQLSATIAELSGVIYKGTGGTPVEQTVYQKVTRTAAKLGA